MHWVLAATLICGSSVMTSCKEARTQEDNAVKEVQSTELIRTSQSWDGVELPDYLQGRPELVAVKYVFPAGKKLGWHHHPVMNYGILVQGELTIIGQDGKEKVVHEGEPVVEMVNTIHHGENRGKKDARDSPRIREERSFPTAPLFVLSTKRSEISYSFNFSKISFKISKIAILT